MTRTSIRCFSCAALLSLITLSFANGQDDWPRFRGAEGNGISESSAPTEWGPDKNIQWKTELPGAGCSSPIVVGGKVFVTCYSGYGESRDNVGKKEDLKRHVVCINQADGKEMWSKTIESDVENEDDFSGIGVTAHGYASHTPVCDGENLFVFFGKGGVVAFDLEGNELWKKKVGDGSDSRKWGSAASPIVHDDLVIVPALAESRSVYGLDKKTGEQKWVCESKAMDNTWSTPMVVDVDDSRSDIVIGVPDELWAINPKTGKLSWAASGVGGEGFYTSAVQSEGIIYASVGGRTGGGSIAIRKGGKKDVTESHVAWNGPTAGSFASPLVYKGHMYVVGRGGVMQVLDIESGKQISKSRMTSTDTSKPANGGGGGRFGSADYGSPVIAGGKIYYTKGNGETFVMNADGKCEQISANKLTDDREIFSGTPAVSKGQILIRSNKYLYCVGS